MTDFFDFDEDIRKATTQRTERIERERIALEQKLEEERIARERKLEEERIARERKLEEERIAREKRIQSNTIKCEMRFNDQKQQWFENMAAKTRNRILELISEGETEWRIIVEKGLSTDEIRVNEGSSDERISRSITVQEIYRELFEKLRKRYSVEVEKEWESSLKGPNGKCRNFTPTGGRTSMSCRCGLGRSEHISTPPQLKYFTISQK